MWLLVQLVYLELFGNFSVRNALMFITTKETSELATKHVFQSPSEHLRGDDKVF